MKEDQQARDLLVRLKLEQAINARDERVLKQALMTAEQYDRSEGNLLYEEAAKLLEQLNEGRRFADALDQIEWALKKEDWKLLSVALQNARAADIIFSDAPIKKDERSGDLYVSLPTLLVPGEGGAGGGRPLSRSGRASSDGSVESLKRISAEEYASLRRGWDRFLDWILETLGSPRDLDTLARVVDDIARHGLVGRVANRPFETLPLKKLNILVPKSRELLHRRLLRDLTKAIEAEERADLETAIKNAEKYGGRAEGTGPSSPGGVPRSGASASPGGVAGLDESGVMLQPGEDGAQSFPGDEGFASMKSVAGASPGPDGEGLGESGAALLHDFREKLGLARTELLLWPQKHCLKLLREAIAARDEARLEYALKNAIVNEDLQGRGGRGFGRSGRSLVVAVVVGLERKILAIFGEWDRFVENDSVPAVQKIPWRVCGWGWGGRLGVSALDSLGVRGRRGVRLAWTFS